MKYEPIMKLLPNNHQELSEHWMQDVIAEIPQIPGLRDEVLKMRTSSTPLISILLHVFRGYLFLLTTYTTPGKMIIACAYFVNESKLTTERGLIA